MSKNVTAFVLLSILFIIIYLSFKLKSDEITNIKESHYETIGLITSVGLKTIDISYTVNGESYVYTQNKPYKNLVVGEEFYTMAYKKDLNRALVYFEQPIIDTIKYKFEVVNAIKIEKLIINGNELSYKYNVKGEEFERIQKYQSGERPDNLKALKIKYRIDNPEIGYLISK